MIRLLGVFMLLLSTSVSAGYSARIIGGEDATTSYPWMAGLHTYFPATDEYAVYPFCGGSLVAPGWVVTAAHCLDETTAAEVLVRINQPSLGSDPAYIPPDYDADTLVLHGSYTNTLNGFDIALVKLSVKANAIDTVSIADSEVMGLLNGTLFTNDLVRALGWGVYDNANFDPDNVGGSDQPLMLQEVDLDFVRRARLSGAPANVVGAYEPNPDGSQPFGADTCFGDSGGPLMVHPGDERVPAAALNPVLVGLTSYGSEDCNSTSTPGIYTEVAAYTQWIEQQTALHGDALADLAISLTHPTRDLPVNATSDDFTVTVTNRSHATTVDTFSLQVTIPGNTDAVLGTGNQMDCRKSSGLACNSLGALAPGASVSYSFGITEKDSTSGTVEFVARTSAQTQDDYRVFNNRDAVEVHYTTGADVAVSLDNVQSVGGTFTLTVSNLSDFFTATGVTVVMTLDPGVSVTLPAACTASPDFGTIECDLGDLAPEQTLALGFKLPVLEDSLASYDISVSATSTSTDPVPGNNSDSETNFRPRAGSVLSFAPPSGGGGGSLAVGLLGLLLLVGIRRR